MPRLRLIRPVAFVFAALLVVALSGCRKESTEDGHGSRPDATVVAIPPIDIKPDGTIGDTGMSKIEAQANAKDLTVAFVRTQLSDAGLAQLAKFPNIRHVEAEGSRITQKGIDNLKKSIPEVQVSK